MIHTWLIICISNRLSVNMDLRRLPTNYDVTEYIFSTSTQAESKKMSEILNQYSKTLIDTWCKSFGSGHTLSVTAIKYSLKKLVKEYHSQIYV